MEILNTLREKGLLVGVAVVRGVSVKGASEALQGALSALVKLRQPMDFPPPLDKDAVRALLRSGGYKPSGRGKPASEYLAQAAREGRFPAVNNLVDVNNYISLASGLPISLLDGAAIGDRLGLRHGRAGESYVFNAAGQTIDLSGLICACSFADDRDEPLGNPVKDSLRGKITDATTGVVGIIYAPAAGSGPSLLSSHLPQLGEWLAKEGAASSVDLFQA